MHIMEEIFHADRERKSTGTLSGYSVRLQYCIAESSLNRIHSVFIQSVIEQGIIQSLLRVVVRKRKEHLVCDSRLEQRIEAIFHKQKSAIQKEAILF